MSGRFPRAKNLEAFWDLLKNGQHSITFFTDEELLAAGVDKQLVQHPQYIKANILLEDIEYFDAAFFDYPPVEAEALDPQIRLFHECAWEALEDAGYDPDTYDGLIGVYSGAKSNAYWAALSMLSGKNETLGYFAATQYSNKDSQSTLTSYKLNLRGPSFTLQTACSTSLVAIHLGCQALLNGECDLALAGGANINMPQTSGYLFQEGMLYSSDGHCRTFDAKADGSIFGSGAGVVILKRMEDAIEDRDHIYAVIKGSAINNDGNRKPGFTAPSVDGQKEAIRAALQVAEIEPESLGYVETHGTATTLGDPVEVEGLKQAFQTAKKGFCGLGSVKTNIGHLDAAAGVAGFIKTVLSLVHKQIPPTLHLETPSPKIDFIDSPFYINTELREWESEEYPLRAGVSTFGVGGTNAHIVLEETPVLEPTSAGRPWQLLCLSAKTRTALDTMTRNLADYLTRQPDLDLADVAYTLQAGRKAFNHRRVLVCRNTEEAIRALAGEKEPAFTGPTAKKEPSVRLAFTQVAEAGVHTGLSLYQTEDVFRQAVNECLDSLRALTGQDYQAKLYPPGTARAAWTSEEKALFSFALAYAAARLLMHWGVKPAGVTGTGAGQWVAACVAGIMPPKEALRCIQLSHRLDLTLEDVENTVRRIRLQKPQLSFYDPTGQPVHPDQAAGAAYWMHQLQAASGTAAVVHLPALEKGTIYLTIGAALAAPAPEGTVVHVSLPADSPEGELKNLLTAAGQLWTYGVLPNWKQFYAGEERGRVSLPTYPFERKRYWLNTPLTGDSMVAAAQAMAGIAASPEKKELADWFYLPSWKRSRLNPGQLTGKPQAYQWIIFADEQGLGEALGKALTARGGRVVLVRKSELFTEYSDTEFGINPRYQADYQNLFARMPLAKDQPGRMVHLWSLSHQREGTLGADAFAHAQQVGLFSLLSIIQSLNTQQLPDDFALKVISRSLHEVSGTEKLLPENAPLLAAVKVIPQEYSGLLCSGIDLAWEPDGDQDAKGVVKQLLEELCAATTETVVAYRGNHRWVETFEPFRLTEAQAAQAPLREQGVYLITGGLGSLGLILAEFLAVQARAKLILTTRTAFPAKAGWADWMQANGENHPLAAKIKRLQALELLGAEVLVVQADAASEADMRQAIQTAQSHFGPLNGVIHSAGIVDGKTFTSLSELTEEDFRQQFHAKAYGLLTLEKVLQDVAALDFCLLMSSMASVLGGLGHAAYTAANLFLDAYVNEHNRRSPQRWLCVNWETIRTVKEKDAFNTLPQLGVNELFITPEQMLTGFRRLLGWSAEDSVTNRMLFATGELEARMDYWIRFKAVQSTEKAAAGKGAVYDRPELSTEYVAPENALETALSALWQQFFSMKQVGVEDNFFELGGDSLKAIMIIEKMHKEVQAKIPIAEFFKQPSIRGVAAYFGGAQPSEAFSAVDKAAERAYYPLSPAQRSMYLIDELHQGTANNGLFVNEVKGKLDRNRIEETFRKLIRRHEPLRTSFELVDHTPYQKTHPDVPFALEYTEATPEEVNGLVEKFVRPFDLTQAPLLRVGIIKLAEARYIFMMDMHHLIADPVSEELLLREFTALYKGEELPALPMQYKDFVAWQEKRLQSEPIKAQEAYWLSEFKGSIPVLNLPTDFERPSYLTFEGDEVKFTLDREALQALKKLAKAEGVTLYMLLLAIYNVWLAKLSGQEDVVVGSPIAGRRHADFERVMGMFLNMLPIRSQPKRDKTCREFIQETKAKVLAAFQHQDYQLEDLVDLVVKIRDVGRNPLFDTTFTLLQTSHYQTMNLSEEIEELVFTAYDIPEKSIKFDLVFQAEEADELLCTWYYRTRLFTRETMEEFIGYFRKTTAAVLENPDAPLGDIKLIDDLLIPQTNILLDDTDDFGF